MDFQKRQKRATSAEKERARELRDLGWNYNAIGENLGFSARSVSLWLNPVQRALHADHANQSKRRNPERTQQISREASLRWAKRNPARVRDTQRRWREDNREHVRELNRRSREKFESSSENYLYAIVFPTARILKIGTSKQRLSSSVAYARRRVTSQGRCSDDAVLIWKNLGSKIEEAYIQSRLAFELQPAFDTNNRSTRLSEWFTIMNYSVEQIVALIDDIYRDIPKRSW